MMQELSMPLHKLTPRERDVFRALLATGGTADEIASRLGIGDEGVRSHLTAIYKKLGVKTSLELLARFVVAPPENAFTAPEFKAPWQV